jgi:hypothetical protein
MAISSQSSPLETARRSVVIQIADVCFEMFSVRELRRPHVILNEILLSFPDSNSQEIREAISLALSWRISLRSLGNFVH